ncbi:MAG: putative PP-loop ATPase, YdaO type, partial [Nitrospira sp.]|nr:putative PP-loop ATPase, YdaO type [Nitrospira sp.]
MNCGKCKTKAVISLPRHNAAFCKGCFTTFVHEQVARAIKSFKMFTPEDRILVAVSGGKDSLALWHVLLKLGYRADALYVNLGIGSYSEESRRKVQ